MTSAVADGTQAQDTQQAPTGASPAEMMDIADLVIEREIGKGGMATIFLAAVARGPSRGRKVALKVMHPHLVDDPQLVRRFEHEVKAQLGLVHPSVVELVGWGHGEGGRLFMAMEYVDGPALKDLLSSGRRFPADVAALVTLRILQGLRAAHGRGLVHRDVKPANVMLTRDGQVKVADFGISTSVDMTRLTSTGNVIGTPAYMSPEQALARPVDHRSDMFSAGVVLYEMLMGTNPFQTGNPATTLSRVVHHHQRPVFETLPQTPSSLEDVLDALLQKDPEKRVATADEAIALLEKCIREEDMAATDASLAAFMLEPDTTARKLCARRARRCFDAGQRAYAGGKGNAEAAVWQFFVASLLDPSNAESRTWLEQVSRERGYNLERKPHPRIEELEASLKDQPDNLPVVLQLAKLHKSQGNFLQVIFYYRRAKALRPPDSYTRHQIETLVSAQAATLIDGTGVFETADHVPVRMRAAPVAEEARAEGWGDFARGILRTTWGRVGLAAAVLAGIVLGVGGMFDHAVQASARNGPRADAPADADLDRQVMALERGKSMTKDGRWEDAEKVYRTFLQDHADSGLASEISYRLGESLERQGRRPEALEVHGENARQHLDEWSLRSRQDRGDLYAVDGDLTSARAEYEAVANAGSGPARVQASLGLAALSRRQGSLSASRTELEGVMDEAKGTPLHDAVRLALADTCADMGDVARARSLYADVRDSTDHLGEPFRRATDGLARLDATGGGSVDPATPTATAEALPAPAPDLQPVAPAVPVVAATPDGGDPVTPSAATPAAGDAAPTLPREGLLAGVEAPK